MHKVRHGGMMIAAGLALAGSACYTDDGGFGRGAVQARSANWNDFRLNDFRLNDFRLNGAALNSLPLMGDPGSNNYIQLTNLKLPSPYYLKTLWLEGGMLNVETTHNTILSGNAVAGTTASSKLVQNGVTTYPKVRFKSGEPLEEGSDIWVYDLERQVGSGAWEPLCHDAHGNPTTGYLVGDAWRSSDGAKVTPRPSNVLSFACRTAALAKCMEFGYRPWATQGGISLADYHQACTRMVRADYCGDGVAHTATGTPIHVLDQLGIQLEDPDYDYVVEAEWGPSGATCLNAENTRLEGETVPCSIPACGEPFASGGVIQSGKLLL